MSTSSESSGSAAPVSPAMQAVVDYLREQRGLDFSGYRPATLGRRVVQAMRKVDITDLDAYLDHLQANPASLDALLDTLLINVTAFFRDPEAWQYLQESVLPALLQGTAGRTLRVWSAGCATGEEAYSLAITLAELIGEGALRERVKIYATDVDAAALGVARMATYSGRALADIPPALRERYLEPVVEDRWRMRPELRRAVVFGRNDLVQDAPISRIDLLTCRNTLMYFNADTQARILDRLHFATATGGVLMLGAAESALGHEGLFSPLDRHRRFYRKEELASEEARHGLDLTAVSAEMSSELGRLHAEAMRQAPVPQLVVSRSGRITFVNRQAVRMLPVSDQDLGRLLQDTDVSYRPADLRSLLMRVRTELHPTTTRDVPWSLPGGPDIVVDVTATPLTGPDGSLLGVLVSYLDVTATHQLAGELDEVRRRLQDSYDDVQSTTEELETTNEELQSTVEELETTNEELQSTNEQLETTNEELRAVNEELHARGVMQQSLTARAEDLNRILDTVLDGLGAGVIVVDGDLHILAWTRSATELWGLRADEVVGRPLESLDIGMDPAHLVEHARQFLPPAASGEAITGGPAVTPGEPVRPPLPAEWIDAVNRRGRPIQVRLAAQPVRLHGGQARVILTVEAGNPGGAAPDPPEPADGTA